MVTQKISDTSRYDKREPHEEEEVEQSRREGLSSARLIQAIKVVTIVIKSNQNHLYT